MNVEYEIKFLNIKKDNIRKKLKKIGGKLIYPDHLQKRVTFNLPKGYHEKRTWLRIRDEGNKITMTLKSITTEKEIEGQKELEIEIGDFQEAVKILSTIGCQKKAYQETKREIWDLDGVEICIDEWPFLNPFIEIEGNSKEEVKKVVKKMGFNYSQGIFGAVGSLYRDKYKVSLDLINNHTPRIVFGEKNPFLE